jgi:ABC-type glutathione transport system ATPase component
VNRAIDSIIHEQHITVILAAHRLSSIARAERVVVIEEGKVSEEGRYDVLVSFSFFRHQVQADDQSRREGSRFRTLMAAQLLVEKSSGTDRREEKQVESQHQADTITA